MSADFDQTAPTLFDCFERSLRRAPYARALELRDEAYSYRQLDQYSRWLAERMLVAHGSRPERIGLLASRTCSPSSVTSRRCGSARPWYR